VATTMEIIISAIDKASAVFEGVGKEGEKAGGLLQQAWVKVGAAGVAAGAGLQKVTERSFELNDGVRRVAAATGESEAALRNMAQGLTTISFSSDDAVNAMEGLLQTGIRNKEEMEKLIPVIDTFGDATGKTVEEGIKLFDAALSATGEPLTNMEQHLDTMTFLLQQTTIDSESFARVMRKTAPDLQAMGMSTEDVTVIMAALEASGIKSREAVTVFDQAIMNAEGSIEKFYANLGISSDALDTQRKRLEESAGGAEKLAEINTRHLGVWDLIKQKVDNAMWSVGTFLEPVKDLGPLLMGLGPIWGGVSKAIGFFNIATAKATIVTAAQTIATNAQTIAQWAWNAAMAANPIGLIILAVAALAAGVYLLIKNWDKVKEFFAKLWDGVKAVFTAFWDWAKDLFFKYHPLGILITHWEDVKEWFANLWDGIKNLTGKAWEGIKHLFLNYTAQGLIIKHWDSIAEWFGETWDKVKKNTEDSWGAIKLLLTNEDVRHKVLEKMWEDTPDWFKQLWGKVSDATVAGWEHIKSGVKTAGAWIHEHVGGVFTRMVDGVKNAFTAIPEFFQSLFTKVANFFKSIANAAISGINVLIKGLNKISFTAPDWVPNIGGKSIGVNIPLIPTLHTGGVFNSSSGEGLALLRDGKVVLAPEDPLAEVYRQRRAPMVGAGLSPAVAGGGGGNIIFERGAFDGVIVSSEQELRRFADRLGSLIAERVQRGRGKRA
jgi:hypothetical protein